MTGSVPALGTAENARIVIDLSGATLELEDQEALVTRRGAITILREASGGSVVGIPECPQLPKGWKVVKSGNDLKLRKASGVMIMVN